MNSFKLINGYPKDLGGGFHVLRLLPAAMQRSVGPFVFMDHFGPAISEGDPAHDVRPHPHIGLCTVSYLFEGALLHHDSTGARQEIRPGDINWMTAGRGIVHSERAPDALRGTRYELHGLQLWCALPRDAEACDPAFQHAAASELPEIPCPEARVRVLVGTFGGVSSPIQTAMPTLYLHLTLAPGARLDLAQWRADWPDEMALYAPGQDLLVNGERLPARQLAVIQTAPGAPGAPGAPDQGLELCASPLAPDATELVLMGGSRLDGPRHLWWNFVSSRPDRIEQARLDWAERRFPAMPGEDDFIPLPAQRN